MTLKPLRNVSVTVVSSVVFCVAFFQILYLLTSRDARFEAGPDIVKQLQSSPVVHILQAAAVKSHVVEPQKSARISKELRAHTECTVTEEQLHEVLAVAADAAQDTGQQAQQTVLGLRSQLQVAWAKALANFKPSTDATTNSSCKSVSLVEHAFNKTRPKTSLLLVMGDWTSLEYLLRLYSLNLFTLWAYARLHGYGLELYVHEEQLPVGMPIYFIKVSGVRYLFDKLGYQQALYLDFDTFTSPHTAPPLSLFYGEFPAASLLLQAEHNVCAAAMLWRNTADADSLLQAWWDLGAAGCCPTFPHDQTALKHMLLAYLANNTGRSWIYGPDMQARFKLPPPGIPLQPWERQDEEDREVFSTDHMPHKVSTWLSLRPVMQQTRSAIGWVGLDSHYPSTPGMAYSRVVLHNCLGMWWGCVPFKTPALLYHTGHWAMEDLKDTWLAERLLYSVRDWVSALDLPAARRSTAPY